MSSLVHTCVQNNFFFFLSSSSIPHTHTLTSACLFVSFIFDCTRSYKHISLSLRAASSCVAVHIRHSAHSLQNEMPFFASDADAGAAAIVNDMTMMMICVINKCKNTHSHAHTITSISFVNVGVYSSMRMRIICKAIKRKPEHNDNNNRVNMGKSYRRIHTHTHTHTVRFCDTQSLPYSFVYSLRRRSAPATVASRLNNIIFACKIYKSTSQKHTHTHTHTSDNDN